MSKQIIHSCDRCCALIGEIPNSMKINGLLTTVNVPFYFELTWRQDLCNDCLKNSLLDAVDYITKRIKTYG